jgi:predicted aspartyl protease
MKSYFSSTVWLLTRIIWVLAISLPLNTTAQQPGRDAPARKPQKRVPTVQFASGNSALKIPLEIDNNIILMRVRVNNSTPLKFIFDTGASHSVINSQRAAELGLKTQGQASGNATGGTVQGSFVKGVSLSVPGAEVSNQLIASLPLPTIPGFEFDGTIGYDFINQFVVEIDYQNKIMNLYSPRTYAYSGRGEVIPLLLAGRRTPLAHTKIILEGRATPVDAKLEVDTGADGTFVINSPFVKKQRLLTAILKTTQDSAVGAGGEQKRLIGRVKAVQLGRLVIDNPPVGLSQDTEGAGASEENDGIIGGEIFRRFKVILDYSRKRMILEPNKSFNDPYDVVNGD